MGHGADQGELAGMFRQIWDQLSEHDSRHIGFNGLKFAANTIDCVGLGVPKIELGGTTT